MTNKEEASIKKHMTGKCTSLGSKQLGISISSSGANRASKKGMQLLAVQDQL